MNKKLFSAGGLIIIVVLLLAMNTLSNVVLKSARIDLTENKLFTLSPGTKNIIRDLDEPVTLRFYFSEKLSVGVPGLVNYARRVRDLLEEYAAKSKGNIRLIVSDPEPFSNEEDQAVQYGLQGVPIDTAGSLAYFGLVGTSSTDEEQVIPFFQKNKEQNLEYDISNLVYSLAHPEKKTVGLMSGLPVEGAPANPFLAQSATDKEWMFVTLLKQEFTVRNVGMDLEKIPDDIDVLMIIHPKAISDKAQFGIDQFVLKGGRAMIFVDPHSETDQPPVNPQNPMAALTAPRGSNLKRLFDVWGVELVSDKIAGDINAATRVNIGRGLRPQSVDYVVWLALKTDNLNKEDIATGELQHINMATSGILRKKEDTETIFTPLIETSASAMQIDKTSVQFGPNPVGLLNDYKEGAGKLTLAARISGEVKTAFPDGPPGDPDKPDKQEEKKDVQKEWLSESKTPINIVVVADTDLLSDKFWVTVQNFFGRSIMIPRADNGVFLVNTVDHLSGSGDLISLRSRAGSTRPFGRVKEIQREAEQRFREREKSLQAKLQETERKINELQREKQGSSKLILSQEQKKEIDQFRAEQLKTRKELRNVQHELRKNIERLGTRIKFINIGLIPVGVVFLALGLKVYQKKKIRLKSA